LVSIDANLVDHIKEQELIRIFRNLPPEGKNKMLEISSGLSMIHVKEKHSVRIYFWCKSMAAINYIHRLLKSNRLAKIIDKVFNDICHNTKDQQNVTTLKWKEVQRGRLAVQFVESVRWERKQFVRHHVELGVSLNIT